MDFQRQLQQHHPPSGLGPPADKEIRQSVTAITAFSSRPSMMLHRGPRPSKGDDHAHSVDCGVCRYACNASGRLGPLAALRGKRAWPAGPRYSMVKFQRALSRPEVRPSSDDRRSERACGLSLRRGSPHCSRWSHGPSRANITYVQSFVRLRHTSTPLFTPKPGRFHAETGARLRPGVTIRGGEF
jgi:hypothetical protein